jgi:Apea-like HEPN
MVDKVRQMDAENDEQKIFREVSRDLDSLGRQIARFQKMSAQQQISHGKKRPEDFWCEIPHPSGKGYVTCGPDGWKKILHLSDLVFRYKPDLAPRLSRNMVVNCVSQIYSELILANKKDVGEDMAGIFLNAVCARIESTLVTIECHFPCVLFYGGKTEKFSVGPVTFQRTREFFRESKDALKIGLVAASATAAGSASSWATNGRAQDTWTGRLRQMYAITYRDYRAYPWVASVRMNGFPEEMAKQKSVQIVNLALSVMRIVVGAKLTSGIGVARGLLEARRSSSLWRDSEGKMHVGISSKMLGPVSLRGWEDMLKPPLCSYLFMLGESLRALADGFVVSHGHQRLIDAVSWYGDAAGDPQYSSKIIKYVSSIETLVIGTRQQGGTKKAFKDRLSALFDHFDCDEMGDIENRSSALYEIRSKALHGGLHRRSEELVRYASEAEEMARMCLLCMSQVCPMIEYASGDIDAEKWEELMQRIQREGVDWLASLAGWKKD